MIKFNYQMSRVSYLQKAEITYKTQAYHTDRMSSIFQTFWSRFWLRDLPQEQDTNAPWQDLFDELSNIIPQQPRVQIVLDNPAHLWHTIQRMKTHKAIGADGWYSEELHKLTWTMVVDLSTLLQKCGPMDSLSNRCKRVPCSSKNVPNPRACHTAGPLPYSDTLFD